MNILKSKKITFTYDNIEVDWNFSNTFNLYFIDEIGQRDFREVDCFSAMNIKTIDEAQKISDQFIKDNYS
jgi:hypothetical protein